MDTNPDQMTILYQENKLDVLNQVQLRIIETANYVAHGLSKLPWIIALIPLFIVGLFMTCVLYLPLLISRKQVTRLTSELIKDIDRMDERNAMLLHSAIEEIRMKFDKFKSGSGGPDQFFVLRPLVTEINRTAIQYQLAESALLRKAYPNFDKPLTTQQTQTLIQAFKVWRDEDGKQARQLALID